MTAPWHRGRGLATRALQELTAVSLTDPRIDEIVAMVRSENRTMQRIFLTLGYEPVASDEQGWLRFRLAVTGGPS